MSELAAELVAATTSILDRIPVGTETPPTGVDTELWTVLADSGFASLDVPDAAGGEDADLDDALAVMSTVTAAGAVTPFVEHALLAAWLAGTVGRSLEGTTATIAVADDVETRIERGVEGEERLILSGVARDVVHAASADSVVVLVPTSDVPLVAIVDLSGAGVHVEDGTDLLGVSLGDLRFDEAATVFHADSPGDAAEVRQRGALAYSAALAAAAGAVHDLSVRYASERIQFGRPLVKFQAIQQRLAVMAARTTMMETAARVAADATSHDPAGARAAVAAAKVVTSGYADEVAAAGHQIHGAIGFTSEHRLGRSTTALWAWRDRHGTEAEWADVLAGRILDDGGDPWEVITGTEAPQAGETSPESSPRSVR
ncbi:acyl-CoA dehydrogenase family protein [Gordonia alkanivorans]|uniref:acyl-CoA dehydrogenase family protein n=1 Tax=Gordonia alkanivorans TaxID=84096 RepID=UPI002448B109|nr:acyl-CoA dehydrogenase family protein [Gordonia alkanivorans]MDH3011187.1 acyl-CoA/acyl-ACP dehydrogenase [Gordonia alkanivorans]